MLGVRRCNKTIFRASHCKGEPYPYRAGRCMNRVFAKGKQMKRVAVLCGILVWTVAAGAFAETRLVPSQYPTIQAAIDASGDGDTVIVSAGRYVETIDFDGRDITVQSTDPNDGQVVAGTIIDGGGKGTAVLFVSGETRQAVLRGFTVTGGVGTALPGGSANELYGGGILCSGSSPVILGNVIKDNHPPRSRESGVSGSLRGGGGILCTQSDARIEANRIEGNTAEYGGGICILYSSAEIVGNVIAHNTATQGAGGIYDEGPVWVCNNLILANTDTGVAGAIYAYAGGQFIHNTIVANTGPSSVELQSTFDGSPFVLVNNIICGETQGYGVCRLSSHPGDRLAYNDVWNNAAGNYNGYMDWTGVEGNLSVNPGFIDAGSGNYHLSTGSLCVDAGDPNAANLATAKDFDGKPRLYGEAVDIGAFELDQCRSMARAGADQHLSRPQQVTLDGSASFFCGATGTRSYQWRQVAGPQVTLSDPGAAKPAFTASQEGQYTFELVVSDSGSASGPDQVSVVIQNLPPIAEAGPRISTRQVPATIHLDGSRSSDPDGDALGFAWRQTEGEAVSLTDAGTAKATCVIDQPGRYGFELVVNDGLASSQPDVVEVIVGNTAPVAVPGPTQYVVQDPVTLDASGSYDPDGAALTYQWRQVSGPALTLDGSDTPYPVLHGIVAANRIQTCTFELVVSDGQLESEPATVSVVIVEQYDTKSLSLQNPPFDPTKPTIVTFNGGDCVTGSSMSLATAFMDGANVLTNSYNAPHYLYGDVLMVYLSKAAPNYHQPIQTMGWSTGAMLATDVAIRLNCVYSDPRYVVQRISYHDAGCVGVYNYTDAMVYLNCHNRTGKPCWIDHYWSATMRYQPGTLNIEFPVPPAEHATPNTWYLASWNPSAWPGSDFYNGGVYGGFYMSLAGPARNLVLAADPSCYYFEWVSTTGYLTRLDPQRYPGLLPEPVILQSPQATADANGVILACNPSRNAVGYELLIGPDPDRVEDFNTLSDTPVPPDQVLTDLPWDPTWWTVRARDAYGSTIYADPLPLTRAALEARITNARTGQRYGSLQRAVDEAAEGDRIVLGRGLYCQNVTVSAKAVTIQGEDPNDPAVVRDTILQGLTSEATIRVANSRTTCVLSGLTVTGSGIGVLCDQSTVHVEGCRLVGNRNSGFKSLGVGTLYRSVIADNGGHGIEQQSSRRSQPTIVTHCVITGNAGNGVQGGSAQIASCTIADNAGSGMACQGSVTNSIVYYNGRTKAAVQIETASVQVTYTDVQGGRTGQGNLDVDPRFARRGRGGDYHLQSQAGRWDPTGSQWVVDAVTSPCIDAGDPNSPLGYEALGRCGTVVNMGAYGGTLEASRTTAE